MIDESVVGCVLAPSVAERVSKLEWMVKHQRHDVKLSGVMLDAYFRCLESEVAGLKEVLFRTPETVLLAEKSCG
ncbi:hypothetical protein AB4876_09375 [Zhongshania guokunii]|uniref:Uncharacterized protein n=1 Tax=Zhongshania guokunii TaxID=641783 RepID=A0ABV3U6C1_9GAMM